MQHNTLKIRLHYTKKHKQDLFKQTPLCMKTSLSYISQKEIIEAWEKEKVDIFHWHKNIDVI